MRSLLALFVAGVFAAHAWAQAPDAKTTQEIFQDWRLQCVEKEGNKRCVVSQALLTGQGRPVAALSASIHGEAVNMEFALPLMLDLSSPMKVQVDERAAVSFAYSTCSNRACFVLRRGDQALVQSFKAGAQAVLKLRLFSGQGVDMKVSLKGFGAALQALQKTAQTAQR